MPFAFVDLDLFEQNRVQILRRAGTKPVRIASKSIRCLLLIQRLLASDPRFTGVMCFSAPEAVFLSQHGLDDLLIGYPCWHPAQIRAVCTEIRRGKTITLMLDSQRHVRHLAAIAAAENVVLPVCLDIDLSLDLPGLHFGVWRSPVTAPTAALGVWEVIQRSPRLRLDGVMGYEAQIAGLGDQAPGQRTKNMLIRLLKRRSLRLIKQRRATIVEALCAAGAALRFVNGGGTGSLETTAQEAAVTEVTAGSGFFSPALFDQYRQFQHLPAAGFATEIVRQPQPHIYTCHGGGYIASGAVGTAKQPLPYLPRGAHLLPLEGAGEVQTPVRYRGDEQLSLGDPIFFRHSKAGELCERFNTLLLIQNGRIVEQAPTYRGAGHSFL